MADLQLEAQLPPAGEDALAFLYKRLGRGRVDGPARVGSKPFGVEHELVLTRVNGKTIAFYGRTPAEVLAKAKDFVDHLLPRKAP